eukprot:CAMPEP_0119016810 /NCGR_PEP_ID=MMETSP1176-20130426/14505_1 /TAXON_ID=265551 /ORGANISM="Synedropsis recta cf, Strain CCMP1620" /LENGTH=156 /DNA_ID=CAMNT_0006970353 /DNA_START=15 /DNA_END=485 /DNA_ORIENTATION=+
MAPRFDKKDNIWIPTGPEEGPEAGYDVWGSLFRQGPSPFLTRVFKPSDYEQAVLKFMAGDKCDRLEAQGNMDAYLRNPADWQYNRMKGYTVDYVSLRPKTIVLTFVWSALVATLVGRGIYCIESGDNFWAILGLKSKVAECVQYNMCVFDEDTVPH